MAPHHDGRDVVELRFASKAGRGLVGLHPQRDPGLRRGRTRAIDTIYSHVQAVDRRVEHLGEGSGEFRYGPCVGGVVKCC